ncbi:hypothetical protein [uncultured Acinetobacter sp.]|uniref:hypothetical protein n=1 Tax=uncultured Acinetobacter sp. TaxID=165433 RepID=UPI0025F54D2F|nr:hypothetical protein [uncultured Acinetobacter sp.]
MAVQEQTPYVEYVANGITTSFALEFDCDSQNHLIVLVDDVEPVVGAWSFSNGAVVFNAAPENGKKITIQRNTPFSRTTDYQSYNNSFRPPSVNNDFDRVWRKLQELGVADWILSVRINALKNYVDDRDDELRAYLMEEIRKQGVALDQLDEYYNYLMQRLAQIAVDKGWDASFVVDESGQTQQQINNKTISTVNTISDLISIVNPKDGQMVYVKSHSNPVWGLLNQLGLGDFVYVSALASQNNGVTVFNGWVSLRQNAEINVTWAGAIGDGVHDDTDAFNIAKEAAIKIGGGVYIPAPRDHYKITSTISFNEKVYFRGDGGTMIDSFRGKTSQGGSRIKYYGNGAAFHLNPILSPTSEQRPAYGVMFKDLIIEGTDAATHGIKVSDKSLINVAGADIGSFNIDNVYLINFKHGRGLELNFCFMNTIRNMFTGDCAVGATLRYAHNTTFLGGSFQQGLLGLDALHSYDVNLHGTCLQGHHPDRAELLGLAMPSDFFVWQGGWDGTGADGVTRNTPTDYAGMGCRVFGSIVSWFGGYEEYNEIGYVTELGSTLRLYGKYVDLDAMSRYWVQIGIGSLTVESPTFAQGQYAKLQGVIHTERNYAAPINITAPNFPTSLPVSKQYTGRTTSNAGVIDQWNPNTFKFNRKLLNTDVEVEGVIQHKGSHCTGGFNKEFRELISPATTVSKTLDFAVGTTGVNFLHLANGVTITVDFNDPNRAQSGVTMKIVLINAHASTATTIIFSDKFKTGSPSYVLDKQKQRVFEFYFENGAWLEVGVPLAL